MQGGKFIHPVLYKEAEVCIIGSAPFAINHKGRSPIRTFRRFGTGELEGNILNLFYGK